MAFSTKNQIKIIHVLKSKLGMDDATYRAMLYGYGVETSTLLLFEQAMDLIRKLRSKAPGKQRFEGLGERPGMAYPGQLRKIEALWSHVSRAEGNEAKRKALNAFIGHRFGVATIEWLPVETVPKVLRALYAMIAQKAEAERKEADNVASTADRADAEGGEVRRREGEDGDRVQPGQTEDGGKTGQSHASGCN